MSRSRAIVSLLPSATEIVCALGARDELVGVSHECDFPRGVAGLPVLTSAKFKPQASSAAIDRSVRDVIRDLPGNWTLPGRAPGYTRAAASLAALAGPHAASSAPQSAVVSTGRLG